MLSETGRKLVVQTVRNKLAVTVTHRTLARPVTYDEHLYLSDTPGSPAPPDLR
ncbi:hypothetical protein [Actinomadura pelletieri]|nr:hypothetical protein [Actinomadura pelletieri]